MEISVPTYGHFFGRLDDELKCIGDFLMEVDRKFGLPDFELVLNHGDLPLSRRVEHKAPFYDFSDGSMRTPVPLFSLVASPHFHDMLFPNVCRPRIGNLTNAVGPEVHRWNTKIEKAFYRGTDRGAINWRSLDVPLSELKSLRKLYDEDIAQNKDEFADFALLEDDLFNATVVFNDPKFVPFEQSQKWKYILDIPGNGYSGSLKQKLTSSSAVFVVSKPLNFPEYLPVTEHFYFGLEAFKHYIPVESPDDLVEKVKWAKEHDELVREIKDSANEFMSNFQNNSHCYAWLLISTYAQALRFEPKLGNSSPHMRDYRFEFASGVSDRKHEKLNCFRAIENL